MLQSIERQSGLPLALDPTNATIRWPESIIVGATSVRTAAEMREYIQNAEARPTRDAVYTVYRNVARGEDAALVRAAGLRYDLTVIPPGAFAAERREFFRTAGHYHPVKAGTDIAYPEVYEVISGRAYWLLQRPTVGDPSAIEEIYAVEAGPGEKAVMLPGFGHISVNVHDEPLVMANWISDEFAYDYEPYRRFHGGGYWLLAGDDEAIEFERNGNYHRVPDLKTLHPAEIPAFGLIRSRPLYHLARDLGTLDFLTNPERHREALALDRCYRLAV